MTPYHMITYYMINHDQEWLSMIRYDYIWLCMITYVKVVQEYERAVIFRLGRLVKGGAKAGF